MLTRSTLFLGNIPHDFDPTAFKAWIEREFEDIGFSDDEEVTYRFYTVRSGHHVYGKCFKTYMFVEFARAVHADRLRQHIMANSHTWQGRRIPAYPALLKEWHRGNQRLIPRASDAMAQGDMQP